MRSRATTVHDAGRRQGLALRPDGLVDGPLPTHYEPHESPVANPLYPAHPNPARERRRAPDNPYDRVTATRGIPYVLTTYRLTEHHTAGGMTRFAAVPRRAAARAVLRGLARSWRPSAASSMAAGRRSSTRAAAIEARVLVTARIRPLAWTVNRPPGRRCRITGARAASSPATSERPLPIVGRPERPHPGGEGADLRHPPGRASGAAATAASSMGSGGGDARAARFFTDTSVCIGCKACEVACKEWNQVPDDGFVVHAARRTTTPAGSAPHVASRRVHRADRPLRRRARGRRRATAWLMTSDVCKHCTHAGCLDVMPDRLDRSHRVRHRRRAGRRLQRLRLLRPRLPVRRDRPRATDDGRAWKCTLCYDRLRRHRARLRQGVPDRSIQFGPLDELRERARRRGSSSCTSAGVAERRPLRRTTPATASAAWARSSCCSTSPRSTACRPTRWSRRATCREMWRAAARRRRPRSLPRGSAPLVAADGDERTRGYYGRPILKPPVGSGRSPGTSSRAGWPAVVDARARRAALGQRRLARRGAGRARPASPSARRCSSTTSAGPSGSSTCSGC